MSESPASTPDRPPALDHPQLAAALEEIQDLDALPLSEHHERLGAVHEVLHRVLNPGAD